MLYAITTSTIVKLEQLISNLLRRWLGLSLKHSPRLDYTFNKLSDAYPFAGGVV